MIDLGRELLYRSVAFVESLPLRPAGPAPRSAVDHDAVLAAMLAPPPEHPTHETHELLDLWSEAVETSIETADPGYIAYIPGGGLFTAAAAELYARVTNRYVSIASAAPALAAMEQGILSWLGSISGLSEGC